MKKALFFCVCMMSVCFAGASGERREGGGFTGPSAIAVSTIGEVKNMPDDATVALEGSIAGHLGEDRYLFTDGDASIVVEIDQDVWNGLTVGPDDILLISGEVERRFHRVEVEVDRIVRK
jgi:uncharacterized protein (TIGR00156 family)